MALTIRKRAGRGYRTVRLEPIVLDRDVDATHIHGRTSQALSTGTLMCGTTVYYDSETRREDAEAMARWGAPGATTGILYDSLGMMHEVRYSVWDAVVPEGT